MDAAAHVVYILLDNAYVPVCAICDQELGKAELNPGDVPTHGYCKRHRRQLYKSWGYSDEQIERILAKTNTIYWHDQHPQKTLKARSSIS